MNDKFYKVEFDPTFQGGDYSGVGNHALISESLVQEVGMDRAFEQTTGHIAANIIHYSEDDRFNILGEQFNVEIPADQTIQLPEEATIDLPEEMHVNLESEQSVEVEA